MKRENLGLIMEQVLRVRQELEELVKEVEKLQPKEILVENHLYLENKTCTLGKAGDERKEKFTEEYVRKLLIDKARKGCDEQVRALIFSFGGKKLSDLKPSCYEELLNKVEQL